MEELKMQNGLLLQLINSKNRQNQILFQQYEQLAQDNQLMQAQIDQLKSQSNEGRRASGTQLQEVASRHSAFDAELADLKKKCGEYVATIGELKRQLQQKGGAIIFLQNQLKNAKLQPKIGHDTEKLQESLKEVSERLESKERSLSELTEYMNQQAEKISDLTKAGITAIENYQAKLQEKDKVNEQLVQQIATLTQQLQQYKEKAVKAVAQAESDAKLENVQDQKVKELQTIILSKEQSITELSEFLQQQTEKVSKLEADLTESNLQALQEQINSLKTIIQGKEQSIVDLSEFLNMLSAKNKEMQEKIQQLERNPSKEQVSIGQEINELKEKLQQYQQQNERLSKEVAENASYINQIEMLRARLSTKEDQMAEKDRHIAEYQQKKAVKAEDINQLRDFVEQMQGFAKQREDEQKYYEDKIKQLTEHIQRMSPKEAQKGSTENQESSSDLQAAIKELQQTIVSKSQTIAQLSEYMNQQSLRIEELQALIAKAPCMDNTNQVQQLEQILKSKETALAELTEYLQETINKNTELTSQLENIQSKQQESNQQQQIQFNQTLKEQEERLSKLQEQLAQKHRELTQASHKLQEMRRLIKQEEKKMQEYEAIATETVGTLDNVNEQLVTLTEEYAQLKEQSEKTKVQYQRNSALLEELRKEVQIQSEKKGQSKGSNQQQQDVFKNQQKGQSQDVARLQAKIAQYEGQLNEKQEQMAAMMEVMENLQAEIQSKNEEIQKFQKQHSPQSGQKIKEMQVQMDRLRQNLYDLQNQANPSQPIDQLEQQYQQVQLQQEMLQKSNRLAQAYRQQLQSMQDEQQPSPNAQIFMQNEQQIENNEELTVLQVIQQILVYSQEQSDMPSFMRLIEVLKRSYLRENQCILKENNELKDSLNRILEINNAIVEERDRFTAEIEELKSQIQEKEETNREIQDKMRRLQSNYQQEIKQLRKSISGLKDQSPIITKQLKQEDLITISKLQDQIIALKQENHKKNAELEHLRAHSNKKFVKELNNLLDSCTVNKDEKDWKELQEELQRANTEKQEVLIKCREYENEIVNLQKRCLELSMLVENLNSNLTEKMSHIEREKQANRESEQLEEHKERLIEGFEGPLKFAQEKASIQLQQANQESFQRLKTQNQELHGLINDKNFAINQLEETLLSLEKGYNSQIMGLRKNIAELQGESIALRKSLYQANPNGVDIGQLIKDTFSQSDKDTEFFRPTFPLYTQHLFDAQPMHTNQSYYSEINRARSNPKRSNYQGYFPTDMSMGQKFMGRKCKQASPFVPYRQEIRANGAWTSSDLQGY